MEYMRMFGGLLLLFALGATSCNQESYSNKVSNCAVKISQGIYGRVFWLEGNQMPQIGTNNKKKTKPGAKPVKRKLLIYPLLRSNQLTKAGRLYQKPTDKPLAVTNTDQDGCYQLMLPPGKYSVFTEETKGLFANTFDGKGNVASIEIKARSLTELNITINYRAVF